jgi:acyl-coenzyme A thioesterase PaaI-like protein
MSLTAKTDHCWVCGPANPSGLQVTFAPMGANGSRAAYVARDEHGGWPGVLHGGVALALMDEALGWSLYFHGAGGVTARFEARFRRPILIGSPLVIRAWTVGRRGRLVKAKADVRMNADDGELLVEADASMFLA